MSKAFRWGGATLPKHHQTVPHYTGHTASLSEPVNRSIHLEPSFRDYYNQDGLGMCSAFSICQACSVHNGRFYDPAWIYYRGAEATGYGDPGAQLHIAQTQGMVVVPPPIPHNANLLDHPATPSSHDQISEYQLLNSSVALEQARGSISQGRPVLFIFGFHEHWVDENGPGYVYLGPPTGLPFDQWGEAHSYHMIMLSGAHDDGQYFESPNSWGTDYPYVRFRYDVFKTIIDRVGYGFTLSDDVLGDEQPLPVDPPPPTPTPPPVPLPVFTCNRCGLIFRSMKKLKRHKLLVHRKRHR